jgi:hypothetical protein
VFYNTDLSLSFLYDYEIDVKLNEDSNSLTCDEKLGSVGIILIISHYYNIPYDKKNIHQYLQDNDYIRDYVENFCQSLHEEKFILLRKILKRFEGISSERYILQYFEGKKYVNKGIYEEERCMIATDFPL